MQKRDHAGLALMAFLIAAAGLLRNHTLLLVLLGAGAFVCVLVIVWDVSRGRALVSVAGTAAMRATEHSPGGSVEDKSLRGVLRAAQPTGRRLAAEALELEPIGHLTHIDDLVRRYNAWEERVSDALAADTDMPAEWRDWWLRDPDPNLVVNPMRENLDRLARVIGERLRLIDQMLRALDEREKA